MDKKEPISTAEVLRDIIRLFKCLFVLAIGTVQLGLGKMLSILAAGFLVSASENNHRDKSTPKSVQAAAAFIRFIELIIIESVKYIVVYWMLGLVGVRIEHSRAIPLWVFLYVIFTLGRRISRDVRYYLTKRQKPQT